MKNYKRLPKQEEVTEFDLGDMKANLVEITDENRDYLLEVVTGMYMDDVCMYCMRNFTFDEVKKSVFAYDNPHGRIVHRECWDAKGE